MKNEVGVRFPLEEEVLWIDLRYEPAKKWNFFPNRATDLHCIALFVLLAWQRRFVGPRILPPDMKVFWWSYRAFARLRSFKPLALPDQISPPSAASLWFLAFHAALPFRKGSSR